MSYIWSKTYSVPIIVSAKVFITVNSNLNISVTLDCTFVLHVYDLALMCECDLHLFMLFMCSILRTFTHIYKCWKKSFILFCLCMIFWMLGKFQLWTYLSIASHKNVKNTLGTILWNYKCSLKRLFVTRYSGKYRYSPEIK